MKAVIASDLHGSATYTERLFERIAEERPDFIVLLGDLLYHGARNVLPDGYDTKRTAALLNEHAERIVAVRGNCDSEVDQMVLGFPCRETSTRIVDGACGIVLLLTHGHIIDPDNPGPQPKTTLLCSGHTHVKVLERRDENLVVLNPGSVSLPKDGSRSYAVYDDGLVTLKSLDDGTPLQALDVLA